MTIFQFFIQDFEKWFLLLFSQHQYHRITQFCLGGIGNIKNSQNTKAELSTCNSSAPTASIYHPTLCNFWWTPWLSGQKTESSSCKEKVITSIHPRAICSNSAVNQRSTPASELICIYHGCLLDRFSQASWSRENVFNDSITVMTHFLQTTFALCAYCLQSIWKTSNEKEDIFLFSEHIFEQKRQVHRKALQMGKPGCNFTFSSGSISTFSILFSPFYSITFCPLFFYPCSSLTL